jgi:hypothetical protein
MCQKIGSLGRFCEPSATIQAAKLLDRMSDYQPLYGIQFHFSCVTSEEPHLTENRLPRASNVSA